MLHRRKNRCRARAWFSWELSAEIWMSFISQKAQHGPFWLRGPRYSQLPSCSQEPRATCSCSGYRGGGPWATPASPHLLTPFSSLSSLHLRTRRATVGVPQLLIPPSRTLSLPTGCCWAGTWNCEAVLAPGPALPQGSWLQPPTSCTAERGEGGAHSRGR